MKKETVLNHLMDHINEVSYIEIFCSSCQKVKTEHCTEDFYFIEDRYKEGWRATTNNCYCPECAKKKLKE